MYVWVFSCNFSLRKEVQRQESTYNPIISQGGHRCRWFWAEILVICFFTEIVNRKTNLFLYYIFCILFVASFIFHNYYANCSTLPPIYSSDHESWYCWLEFCFFCIFVCTKPFYFYQFFQKVTNFIVIFSASCNQFSSLVINI